MMDTHESKGDLIESLESLVRELNPNDVILVLTAFMVVLAVIDLGTFFGKPLPQGGRVLVRHRDLKTSIVSLGVLGTFIGITIGLVRFDTSDTLKIHENIPELLSGLKVAFYTSVVGMALSIALAVIQRLVSASAGRDNTEQLDRIVELTAEGNKTSQVGLERLSADISALRDELRVIGNRISALSGSLEQAKPELLQRLDGINSNLEQALERIARDANRTIIEMLRQVVEDFNVIIQEQFGESLRQLSQACENLLVWQEQHKDEVDAVHQQLQAATAVLERTVDVLRSSEEKTRSVLEMCEGIKAVILDFDAQTQTTTGHLEQYASVAERIKETLLGVAEGINSARNEIVNLASVSQEKFSEQVETQGAALDSMKETARKIEAVNSDVAEHTGKTQTELNERAEHAVEVVQGVISGSAEALATLETNLTRVTDHLRECYGKHLDQLGDLVEALGKSLDKLRQEPSAIRGRTNE